MMSRLLILGGSGFFGKSILDAYSRGLLKPWGIDNIVVISRHAAQLKISHPWLIDGSILLINGDISTLRDLPNADFVIHAAASTNAANYLLRPLQEKQNIQAATLNYCQLAKKYHRNSKIIYCSSGAAYGHQPADVLNISEDYVFGPIDGLPFEKRDYAAAKRDAEIEINKLGMAGLNVCIVRCFTFLGPYLPLDQHFAIGNFIRDGLRGDLITVNAKSAVYRSYLYADDLVRWLMRIGQMSSIACPVFNVGSDESISIQDLAKKLAIYFQVDLQLPKIESQFVDRYIPSIEKARSIGCHIEYSLDRAIDATVSSLP